MKTYLKYSGTKSCLVELKDLITMKLTNIKKDSISHIDIYIYILFFCFFVFEFNVLYWLPALQWITKTVTYIA